MQKLSRAEAAFLQTLFEDNNVKIHHIIRRQLRESRCIDAEDIVQETYCRACEKIRDLMASPNPEAWLIRTAHLTAYEAQRRLNRDAAVSDLPDRAAEPPQKLGLDGVLPQATSPQERDLLVRYYDRRDTAAEIAGDLHLSSAAVRQRLKRARDRLRKSIHKNQL